MNHLKVVKEPETKAILEDSHGPSAVEIFVLFMAAVALGFFGFDWVMRELAIQLSNSMAAQGIATLIIFSLLCVISQKQETR